MSDKYQELLSQIDDAVMNKDFAAIKQKISFLNVADIAEILDHFSETHNGAELSEVFRLLPKTLAAEVFSYLPVETGQTLISALSDKETAAILDEMFADDAADLLEEIPANVVKRLLSVTSAETRNDINRLLKYPEDSAGSIMTVEFMDLKQNLTVNQAIERIRRVGTDKETVNTCYVLSENRELIGMVTLRKLVLSGETEKIYDIMQGSVMSVVTHVDQEEVAAMFTKYDLTTMPVVDSENRLVGIITIDDIVDVMRDEATEDIEIMAAITPSERPYLKTGVFATYWQRIPWLMLLMLSATITSGIIKSFEGALAACVALTSFVPMLTDTGGNSGSQASVTVIRGLSIGEIRFRDTFKVILKELGVSMLCGLSLAVVNFLKMTFIDHTAVGVTLTVCITLALTVIAAKLVGCTLPILAKRMKLDPAVMASPFITTIVDALALLLYFNIAEMILKL